MKTMSVSDIKYQYCQVASALSLVCSAAVVAAWCMLPRWRSLHNYISVHQITTGSLHLSLHFLMREYYYTDWMEILGQFLLFLSLCWSLCGQLLAYAWLVLLLPRASDDEDRRWAFLLSYGTLITVKCITEGVVPYIFYPGYYFSIELHQQGPRLLSEMIVMTMNVLLYVTIARGLLCCPQTGSSGVARSRARGRMLAGLIGVTILSDVVAVLYLITDLLVLHILFYESEFAFEIYKILKMVAASRLVVQTVIVLFNVRSREEFVRYYQVTKNQRRDRF